MPNQQKNTDCWPRRSNWDEIYPPTWNNRKPNKYMKQRFSRPWAGGSESQWCLGNGKLLREVPQSPQLTTLRDFPSHDKGRHNPGKAFSWEDRCESPWSPQWLEVTRESTSEKVVAQREPQSSTRGPAWVFKRVLILAGMWETYSGLGEGPPERIQGKSVCRLLSISITSTWAPQSGWETSWFMRRRYSRKKALALVESYN